MPTPAEEDDTNGTQQRVRSSPAARMSDTVDDTNIAIQSRAPWSIIQGVVELAIVCQPQSMRAKIMAHQKGRVGGCKNK